MFQNIWLNWEVSLLANQIIDGFDKNIVLNFVVKQVRWNYQRSLLLVTSVIGNDSGGMHLANAVRNRDICPFRTNKSK